MPSDLGKNRPSWIKTHRSKALSGRVSRDTQIELALRRELHRRGLRYRVHYRVTSRNTADIVFTRIRVAIFVDGCFWHGCPKHEEKNWRGPNAQLWSDKLRRTKERDARVTEEASTTFLVLRYWECEIKSELPTIADTIESIVRSRRALLHDSASSTSE